MKASTIVRSLLVGLTFSVASPAADPKSKDARSEGTSIKPKPGDIIEPKPGGEACTEEIDLDTCTISCVPVPCVMQSGQTCSGQLPKERCAEATAVPERNS